MENSFSRVVSELTTPSTDYLYQVAGSISREIRPDPPVSPKVDLKKHPSGIIPVLQNVVATCSLGCKLDLKNIAQRARNAEYNPKRFAAVIMRIREPKTTSLIFSSGKLVCTGAKSEQEARLASRKFAKIIMKLGNNVTFSEFKVQNIVGSCDVQFSISLEGLNYRHNLFTRYEPELFPGLIYKMKVPKVVLLIFVSGKVVLTGAKSREDIYRAFENIYPTVMEFRKMKRKPLANPESSNHLPSISTSNSFLNEEKHESRAALSPFLGSARSHSIVEDSKSMTMPESFHSPFSLYVANSRENIIGSGSN